MNCIYFVREKRATPTQSQSTLSVWSDAENKLVCSCSLRRQNRAALCLRVYRNNQTSADREIKRRWHIIWGVQSDFRLAGRTNASQTSVSKVTELMRPLQTKAFGSPILTTQSTACQTVALIDVKCCQSVSRSSNQTNNNVFFIVFALNPKNVT